MSITSQPHVLIIGAGLGGLALAQALRKQGIPFEVFERDQSLTSRFQGWALSVHRIIPEFEESLPDDMPPIGVVNHLIPLNLEPQFKIYDDHKNQIAATEGKNTFIRASRRKLRQWLATNIEVNWDKRLTRIEETNDKVTAFFEDGTSATGDVLVGADGVRSPTRDHVFHGKDQLRNLPLTNIVGKVRLNKEQYQNQMKLAHSMWLVSIKNSNDAIFAGLDSVDEDEEHANYYWYLNIYDLQSGSDSHWMNSASAEDQYQFVLERTKLIDPSLTELIHFTKPSELMMPPLLMRDLQLDAVPEGRVTLLGDAAHAMTPYRGEGGDHAMRDGLHLAKELASAKGDVVGALQSYAKEMLERGNKAVRMSREAVTDGLANTKSVVDRFNKEKYAQS